VKKSETIGLIDQQKKPDHLPGGGKDRQEKSFKNSEGKDCQMCSRQQEGRGLDPIWGEEKKK